MVGSKVLRVEGIGKPIDGKLYAKVELSCCSCDGSGWVRVRDVELDEVKANPRDHICLKCTGEA